MKQPIRTDSSNPLKGFEEWKNLKIFQEPSGCYAIESSQGESIGFEYKSIETIENFLIAFLENEKESFHIYDEDGVIKKYDNQTIIGKSYYCRGELWIITEEKVLVISKETGNVEEV